MKYCTPLLALALALPVAAYAESKAAANERVAGKTPPAIAREAAVASPGDALTRFKTALESRRFDEASREAQTALDEIGGGAALLDELTYRLVGAGAHQQAARLLLRAYPFSAGAADQRALLFERLSLLVEDGQVADRDRAPLRQPLDTPALRRLQGAMWATMKDCAVVRDVLGDLSAEYGYDDLVRLGDCSAVDDPSRARQAYARAHSLQPGGVGSRALAYAAFAAGDRASALAAWRTVPSDQMSADDLLGAATTALAAGDAVQASGWLSGYQQKGGFENRRYWTMVAQSRELQGDVDGAIGALQQSVAIAPQSEDYRHLARLTMDADRQVTWLGQAVALAPGDAAVQLDLAYALTRAGRNADAVAAFERAAAMNPSNPMVQLELGYAYMRVGNLPAAAGAFERSWKGDQSSVAAAQELVYINQRLSRNAQAKKYAEAVIDGLGTHTETARSESDARFGFQRLHEDLGRRLTVNLDGWSGTHVGTGTPASRAGDGFRSYSQVEADVRLGSPAIRNGRTVSAYFRLIGDGGAERRAWPAQNSTLGVGLRWKPFGSRVFYVAAEQQTSLDGPERHDTLLRASASLFNGGRFSDDWHASPSGWFAQNVYLDAAHYTRADYSAATADYRASYHQKVAARATIEPYAHFQVNGVKLANVERDVRVGVGTRFNLWAGASHYNADPHKVAVGVEYQQTLETYLPDTNGVFGSLSFRW
jgi:adsorption protein A